MGASRLARAGPIVYCVWAALAIGLSLARGGLSPENVTRLLVLLFLFVQLALRAPLTAALPGLGPRARFVILGTSLAAVVEGFHMISTPVFLSLCIDRHTSLERALANYGLDLLFTVPAYLVLFAVICRFLERSHFPLWRYVILIGLAQTLGDGGLFFFLNAPALLLFLPYPMTNYHAINVIPFLAVRDRLPPRPPARAGGLLAILGVIATYLVCGTAIRLLGRAFGLT